MKQNKIAIAIVPYQCRTTIIDTITKVSNATTHTFEGKGTAHLTLLQNLGLGQTKKSVIVFSYNELIHEAIQNSLQTCMCMPENHTGIFFTVLMEKSNMEKVSNHLVVCVIVNAGYGEEVMQEARKAGARGGTIVNAKGTGKGNDMDFFGIPIIPEKEVLIMVAERELAIKLVEVVKAMPLLTKPGSGIVFTLETDSYTHLGGK